MTPTPCVNLRIRQLPVYLLTARFVIAHSERVKVDSFGEVVLGQSSARRVKFGTFSREGEHVPQP